MESDDFLPLYIGVCPPPRQGEYDSTVDDILYGVDCVVDNVGWGFLSGMALGSVYHFFKGFLNSNSNSNSNSISTSIRSRLGGGLAMARANAPLVAGRAGLFSVLLMAVGTPLAVLRENKFRFSPYRPSTEFIAGSAAAAAMTAARGPRVALRSALLGGSLWALPQAYIRPLIFFFILVDPKKKYTMPMTRRRMR